MTDADESDRDLTAEVAAETDVARTGRHGPPSPHERTADEDDGVVDWEQIAAMPEFQRLLRAKAAFVVPATMFFVLYYFSLPVLVGWFPDLMRKRIGPVNLAYAFALSQFFMAWTIAFLYLRRANDFDRLASEILATFEASTTTPARARASMDATRGEAPTGAADQAPAPARKPEPEQ